MANNYDLSINAGATYKLRITVQNTNITDYDFAMKIKRNYTSTAAAVDATTANGLFVISDGANGVVDLTIPASTTANMSDSYVYDVEMDTGSEITRIMQGSVTVSPEVTK